MGAGAESVHTPASDQSVLWPRTLVVHINHGGAMLNIEPRFTDAETNCSIYTISTPCSRGPGVAGSRHLLSWTLAVWTRRNGNVAAPVSEKLTFDLRVPLCLMRH